MYEAKERIVTKRVRQNTRVQSIIEKKKNESERHING